MKQIIQTVSLTEARFYAPIGFYPEEQILGNEFFVDLSVSFVPKDRDQEDLSNTVNYERLYAIIQEVMQPKRQLLESAAHDILESTYREFPFISQASVSIRKPNPPFGGDVSNSMVTLSYLFD